MKQLIPAAVLGALPGRGAATLTGTEFFPNLISAPFKQGPALAFVLSIVAYVIAAIASWLRADVHEHSTKKAPTWRRQAECPRLRPSPSTLCAHPDRSSSPSRPTSCPAPLPAPGCRAASGTPPRKLVWVVVSPPATRSWCQAAWSWRCRACRDTESPDYREDSMRSRAGTSDGRARISSSCPADPRRVRSPDPSGAPAPA